MMLQLVEGIAGAALAGAVDALLVTQQNADRAGIAAPGQGWGPWATALASAARGQLDPALADTSIGTPSTSCRPSAEKFHSCCNLICSLQHLMLAHEMLWPCQRVTYIRPPHFNLQVMSSIPAVNNICRLLL